MLQFTAFLLHFWSLLAQLFLAPHGLANCFSPESQSPILFSNKHETPQGTPRQAHLVAHLSRFKVRAHHIEISRRDLWHKQLRT
jgi:hypothetical protein